MEITITRLTGIANDIFADFSLLQDVTVERKQPKLEIEKTDSNWLAKGDSAYFQHTKQVISSDRFTMILNVSKENDFTNIYKATNTIIKPDELEAQAQGIGRLRLLDAEIEVKEHGGSWTFIIDFTADKRQDISNLVTNAVLQTLLAPSYRISFVVKNPTLFVKDVTFLRVDSKLQISFTNLYYAEFTGEYYCNIGGYDNEIEIEPVSADETTGAIVYESAEDFPDVYLSDFNWIILSKYSDVEDATKKGDISRNVSILTKFKPKLNTSFSEDVIEYPDGRKFSNKLEITKSIAVPFFLEDSEMSLIELLAQAKEVSINGYKSMQNTLTFERKDTDLINASEFELNFDYAKYVHNKFN